MFEPNMDEYLDEEVEYVKHSFEMTCRSWEKQVSSPLRPSVLASMLTFGSYPNTEWLRGRLPMPRPPVSSDRIILPKSSGPFWLRSPMSSCSPSPLSPELSAPRSPRAALPRYKGYRC